MEKKTIDKRIFGWQILFFLMCILSNYCFAQDYELKGNKNYTFSLKELNDVLQSALDLNHIDIFFNKEEKNEGLTILINEFLEPYYKNLHLEKFSKEVNFKTYNEIFIEKDLKFVDFMEVFSVDKNLKVSYGLRYKNLAVIADFKKDMYSKSWNLLTRNSENKDSIRGVYHFNLSKTQCLIEQIKGSTIGLQKKCNQFVF